MDVNFVVLGAACHTSVLRVLGDCCVTCDHFYNGIYQFLIYAINLWRFFTLGAFFVVYIRHDMTLHALTFLFRGFQIPWQLGAMHLKYEQYSSPAWIHGVHCIYGRRKLICLHTLHWSFSGAASKGFFYSNL